MPSALSAIGTGSNSLTMADVMIGPSLNRIARESGKHVAMEWIIEEVTRAARLCSTDMPSDAIADAAEMIFDRFKFRTANALRLALRDGMNAGKIFGKLTYPVIAEWLTAHEEAVISDSDNAHDATK